MTNNDTLSIDLLARRIANALNRLFEATMNDYSMQSIEAAENTRDELFARAKELGCDNPKALATFDRDRGYWVSAL